VDAGQLLTHVTLGMHLANERPGLCHRLRATSPDFAKQVAPRQAVPVCVERRISPAAAAARCRRPTGLCVAMASLLAHDSFQEGFAKSALMILVSEIGDKTFFIAAIMAMRHPQLQARPCTALLLGVPTLVSARVLTPLGAGAGGRPGRPVGHDGPVCCAGVGSTSAGALSTHCRTGPHLAATRPPM
jgi:hypothetical protein